MSVFCISSFRQHVQKILSTHICISFRAPSFLFLQSRISVFVLFFLSSGVSSNPAFHPDLYPCWSYEADHPTGSEPAAASVWTEELWVYLSHPRQHTQCPGSEVQQHQHTVSEDHGKTEKTNTNSFMYTQALQLNYTSLQRWNLLWCLLSW